MRSSSTLMRLVSLMTILVLLTACGSGSEVEPQNDAVAEDVPIPTEQSDQDDSIIQSNLEMQESVEETTGDSIDPEGIEPMEMTTPRYLAEDGNYTRLYAAIEAAGLWDELSTGEYTLLAPDDNVFAMMPEEDVTALMSDSKGALVDVLAYHVVSGTLSFSDIAASNSLQTLQGETIQVTPGDMQFTLNGSISVIGGENIVTENGRIHTIDGLLMPEETTTAEQPNMAAILRDAGNFETLLAVLETTGLDAQLSSSEMVSMTLFAPTDAAFANLSESVTSLLENPQRATAVLQYHLVPNRVTAADLVSLQQAGTMLGNAELRFGSTASEPAINGDAAVIGTDILASNGVIHIVDEVLIPSEEDVEAALMDDETETEPAGTEFTQETIEETLIAAADLQTLRQALEESGLIDVFINPAAGPFTLLAPADEAFAALPEEDLTTLLNDPEGELTSLLQYHVIEGDLDAAALAENSPIETLQGDTVTVEIDDTRYLINGEATFVTGEISTANGTIHIIDTVLTPPESDE